MVHFLEAINQYQDDSNNIEAQKEIMAHMRPTKLSIEGKKEAGNEK